MPVWRGELYFETHRGTLTSQLRTKLGNKRCERLLREVELWTATAGGGPGDVDELWREVLTLQFHDIIPGSSIAWVHDEAEAAHRRIGDELEARVAAPAAASWRRPGRSLANPATRARDEVVVVAPTVAPAGDGPVPATSPTVASPSEPSCPGSGSPPAVAARAATTASSSPTARWRTATSR